MGLMKRYLVAVVGVPGSPAQSQRSEVGAYRTESAARQAGADEWRRILFVHAPHIDRYRVVIERDGTEVGEVPMPEVPADAAPGILDETVTPLGVTIGAAGELITPEDEGEPEAEADADADADAPGDEVVIDEVVAVDAEPIETTGEMAVIADEEPLDAQITGQQPVVPRDDDEVAADEPTPAALVEVEAADDDDAPPSPPAYVIEDPPDGPVPDDIIARFAEAVRGEEERAAERSDRERDRGK